MMNKSYVRKTTWENLYTKLLMREMVRGENAQEKAIGHITCPVAIHAAHWDDAVLKMGDKQTLRNRSDVLLGFEVDRSAEGPVTIDVGVGRHRPHLFCGRLTVTPGGFVPAMKGVHCLPTIALAYHDINLSSSDSSRLCVVQALMGQDFRKDIADTRGQSGILLQFDDGYHIIKSGMCQEWVPGQHPRDDPRLYVIPRID